MPIDLRRSAMAAMLCLAGCASGSVPNVVRTVEVPPEAASSTETSSTPTPPSCPLAGSPVAPEVANRLCALAKASSALPVLADLLGDYRRRDYSDRDLALLFESAAALFTSPVSLAVDPTPPGKIVLAVDSLCGHCREVVEWLDAAQGSPAALGAVVIVPVPTSHPQTVEIVSLLDSIRHDSEDDYPVAVREFLQVASRDGGKVPALLAFWDAHRQGDHHSELFRSVAKTVDELVLPLPAILGHRRVVVRRHGDAVPFDPFRDATHFVLAVSLLAATPTDEPRTASPKPQ
jgi:hypothetical protein